eukprot:SM000150S01715  [mRNA]  locus=s150:177537:178547:- [translate_table: standard]
MVQVAQLCTDLKREAAPRPFLIAVDQEGGPVSRLGPPFTPVPAARVLGSLHGAAADAAASAGTVLGRELRAVNIDMDFAPVVDVDSNPANPVIGRRSFGPLPDVVAEMGYRFVRALQREGVAACAKHFPGHGDTSLDSHLELPVLRHDLARLQAVELRPFAKAVEADVAAVMVAHIAVAALDSGGEDTGKPASLSAGALQHLRGPLRFEGVAISDCLEMGAIAKHYSVPEAAVQALAAGMDMVLVCHTESRQVGVIDAITNAVAAGRVSPARLREAGARARHLAQTYVRTTPPQADTFEESFSTAQLQLIGCSEHHAIVADILRHAANTTSSSRQL